jgi:catechol 2,3-dioxygenase-like lactoylglutathione lyase family enzyme
MNFTLDHVVFAVTSLDAAAATFGRDWGLHVVKGGSHPNWGTHNSLCHFGLPYVEFIAVQDAAVAVQSDFGRWVLEGARAGGGLVNFALGTSDLDGAVAALRQAGVAVDGPQQGRRQRPDGSWLSWRLAFPAPTATGLRMPFLIEWAQDDRAREADLRARGVIGAHRWGDVQLSAVACAVPSLEAALQAYSRYFGLQADPATGLIRLGRGAIRLCEAPERAPGPFRLELTGGGAPRTLEAHGAVWQKI